MNKRISKFFGILFLLLELALVPKAVELMFSQHFSSLPADQILVLAMTFGSIALCIVMSFSSLNENDAYPLQSFYFELMIFLCCAAPLTDLIVRSLENGGRPGMSMAVNTAYYLIGIGMAYVTMLYEFSFLDRENKPVLKKIGIVAAVLAILDVIVTVLNIPFGFFFSITETGHYQSAPTFWISYLVPLLIVVITAVVAAKEMPKGRQRGAFVFFWIFALVASLLQAWHESLSIQYTGFALSMIVIYVNVQSELDSFFGIPQQRSMKIDECK